MRLADCPVRAAINVIEGKWKPIIINALKAGPLRYGQLRREAPEATKKVLTAQLRELERAEILCRKNFEEDEEHVRYALTPYGRTLVPVITELAEWGANHKERVAEKTGCRARLTEERN